MSDKVEKKFSPIGAMVYPSNVNTIRVTDVDDQYGGAHIYAINPMVNFDTENKVPVYDKSIGIIPFVKKDPETGEFIPGFQTEQILLMLIDRHLKLSSVFPSDIDEEFISHLSGALNLLEGRVRERTARGVIGKLEK